MWPPGAAGTPLATSLCLRKEKSNRGGREAADDCTTGGLVKAFQISNGGNAKKRKLLG